MTAGIMACLVNEDQNFLSIKIQLMEFTILFAIRKEKKTQQIFEILVKNMQLITNNSVTKENNETAIID